MQLRHKFFIALSLLTSVPLLVLLYGVVERMENEVRARTETELHGTLNKMASEIDLILNNQKAIADGLARVPAVRHFANVATENKRSVLLSKQYQQRAEELEQFFLNYQHSVSSIQALRYIDNQGKTLVKVKEGRPIVATHIDEQLGRMFVADQANRPFFKDAQATTQNVVMSDFELGQVVVGADFCPAMVRYSVPIKDEVGQFDGVLVVNMWGERLDATMKAALGGYPGKNYIVELSPDRFRDGIYLYHPDNTKRFANQLGSDFRLSNELTATEWEYISNSEKSGSVFRDDGRMLFFTKLLPYADRPTQWLLVIEASQDVILAPINSMRKSIWLLLGVLVMISLLLAVWASGRLTHPVHQLALMIRRFADGERTTRYQSFKPSNDEVSQAGHAFNYLAESLERTEQERESAVRAACQSERLAAIGQLAAGIGHEINNPLMNIMSLASLIDESLVVADQQVRSDLKLLQKECQRCSRIVQGVLNFARQSEPSYVAFDFAQLLIETLELLKHRIEHEDIELHTHIDDELTINGDASQLQQVLVNVLLNAIQASPAGSMMSVSAKNENDNILVEIADQGEGIDAANFSKIFDPFFTTKPEGEGTGLGLSVSYGIVKKHGGTISIKNIENSGVRVTILLPVEYKSQQEVSKTLHQVEAVHGR